MSHLITVGFAWFLTSIPEILLECISHFSKYPIPLSNIKIPTSLPWCIRPEKFPSRYFTILEYKRLRWKDLHRLKIGFAWFFTHIPAKLLRAISQSSKRPFALSQIKIPTFSQSLTKQCFTFGSAPFFTWKLINMYACIIHV